MEQTNSIGHEGIVERVVNGAAFVAFRHSSGCAGCSVRSACGMADSTDKIFKIPLGTVRVNEGDPVTIKISLRHGYRAVVAGYLIPFLLVVASLSVGVMAGLPEAMAGIISLVTLAPYYGLLRVFRNRFSNDLSIEAQKP